MSRIALTAIGVICAMATWIYTVTDTYVYNHYQLSGNALNVKDYLEAQGFAAGAVVGIIANMEHESYMNSGQCEIGYNYSTSRGYGLVQWTPGTKIINYATSVGSDWYDGDTQMDFLMINAPASWGSAYPVTWADYKNLTDPYYATEVFFYNFERGTWHNVMYDYADYWYQYLYGTTPPTPPVPPPTPPGDYNLITLGMYSAKSWQ